MYFPTEGFFFNSFSRQIKEVGGAFAAAFDDWSCIPAQQQLFLNISITAFRTGCTIGAGGTVFSHFSSLFATMVFAACDGLWKDG